MNAIMSVAMTANEVRRWARQAAARQAATELEGVPMTGAGGERRLRRDRVSGFRVVKDPYSGVGRPPRA